MKLNYTLLIVLSSFIILTINSCKKDNEDEPSKTELITEKDWKMSSVKMDPGIMGFTDASYYIEECVKDNQYTFKTNGSIVMNEGDSKCDSTAQQEIEEGTWAFNDDQSQIIFSDSEFFGEMTLSKLTVDELILSRTEMLPDTTIGEIEIQAGEQTIKITFIH